MKLNSKGFAPWSLLIAAGVVVLTTIVLVLPRSNEYADIAPMKASRRTLSDSDVIRDVSPLVDMLNVIQTTIGIILTGIFGFILGNKIRNQ